MTTMKWSPWSDSHRRIRVYETRPVAAEARGLGKWRSHVDLHHEFPASQTGVQNYLHLESMASVIGLAPIRPGLKDRLRELLCIHGPLAEGHKSGHWSRNRTDTSWASARRAD